MTKTFFAAHDDLSIYAIADSPENAIAKARDDARDDSAHFQTAICPAALAQHILENGWNGHRNSFDVISGIIVDTTNDA